MHKAGTANRELLHIIGCESLLLSIDITCKTIAHHSDLAANSVVNVDASARPNDWLATEYYLHCEDNQIDRIPETNTTTSLQSDSSPFKDQPNCGAKDVYCKSDT